MKFSRTQFLIIGLTAVALLTIDVALRTMQLRQGTVTTTVTAQKFRLVDRDGNRRAELSVDNNGEPGFFLYDRAGSLRAMLDTRESTPSLILLAPGGTRRSVYFGMDESGDTILDMYDPSGRTVATMTTTNGVPRMKVAGDDGAAPIGHGPLMAR